MIKNLRTNTHNAKENQNVILLTFKNMNSNSKLFFFKRLQREDVATYQKHASETSWSVPAFSVVKGQQQVFSVSNEMGLNTDPSLLPLFWDGFF